MTKVLNNRQNAFIKAYLSDKSRNATNAAIKAGYAEMNASQGAARLMKNPLIAARIKEELNVVLDAAGVTPQRVMDELARMAFFRPEDFVTINEAGELETKVTSENLHKLIGVTNVQVVAGHLRFSANKEKALEMLVKIMEIDAQDDDDDGINIMFAEFPDDENSGRTATNG